MSRSPLKPSGSEFHTTPVGAPRSRPLAVVVEIVCKRFPSSSYATSVSLPLDEIQASPFGLNTSPQALSKFLPELSGGSLVSPCSETMTLCWTNPSMLALFDIRRAAEVSVVSVVAASSPQPAANPADSKNPIGSKRTILISSSFSRDPTIARRHRRRLSNERDGRFFLLRQKGLHDRHTRLHDRHTGRIARARDRSFDSVTEDQLGDGELRAALNSRLKQR